MFNSCPTRCALYSLFLSSLALHVSDAICTHHKEHNCSVQPCHWCVYLWKAEVLLSSGVDVYFVWICVYPFFRASHGIFVLVCCVCVIGICFGIVWSWCVVSCAVFVCLRFWCVIALEQVLVWDSFTLHPLPVQFKSLLHGQEGCVFFSGHLNLRTCQYVWVRLARRATFKFSTFWYVRAGKWCVRGNGLKFRRDLTENLVFLVY
jgi:hypothetical protein